VYGQFRPILQTAFFQLEEAASINPDQPKPYYRLVGPDSVICCLLDLQDRFVMVRQYRPNLEMKTLETPAGGIERGELPLEAIRREIMEEAGLQCALLPLGQTFSLMMNRTNVKDHLFFGMFPEEIENFVPEAGIEVIRVPRQELRTLAMEGQYLQLAGLGLLQLAGGVLKVDMWQSPLSEIEKAFRAQPAVNWNPSGQ